jgi:hypothetical protein
MAQAANSKKSRQERHCILLHKLGPAAVAPVQHCLANPGIFRISPSGNPMRAHRIARSG